MTRLTTRWPWLLLTLFALGCTGCSREQALNFEALIMQILVLTGLGAAFLVNLIIGGLVLRFRQHDPGTWMAFACWILALPAVGLTLAVAQMDHPDGVLALFVLRPHTEMAPGWYNVPVLAGHLAFALAAGYRGLTLPDPPDEAERGADAGPMPPHASDEPRSDSTGD